MIWFSIVGLVAGVVASMYPPFGEKGRLVMILCVAANAFSLAKNIYSN